MVYDSDASGDDEAVRQKTWNILRGGQLEWHAMILCLNRSPSEASVSRCDHRAWAAFDVHCEAAVPVFILSQLCSAIRYAPLFCRHCAGERVRRREPARMHAARAVSRRAVGLQTRLQTTEQCTESSAPPVRRVSRKGALAQLIPRKEKAATSLYVAHASGAATRKEPWTYGVTERRARATIMRGRQPAKRVGGAPGMVGEDAAVGGQRRQNPDNRGLPQAKHSTMRTFNHANIQTVKQTSTQALTHSSTQASKHMSLCDDFRRGR